MVANTHTLECLKRWALAINAESLDVYAAPRFVKWCDKQGLGDGSFGSVTFEYAPGGTVRVQGEDHLGRWHKGDYVFTRRYGAEWGSLRRVGEREATEGFMPPDKLEREEKDVESTALLHWLTDPYRAPNIVILVLNMEAVVWRFEDDSTMPFEFKMHFNIG